MPKIGELARGRDIGKKGQSDKFTWQACIDCGKERWITFREGKPKSQRCPICGGKSRKGTKWTKGQWEQLSGENAARFNGGRRTTKYGYIEIILPYDDFFRPMVDSHGRVKEHRLIVARALGRCLLPWEIVHHKNGVKDDNRFENLELLPTKKYHIIDSHTQSLLKRLQKRILELEKENHLLQSKLKN